MNFLEQRYDLAKNALEAAERKRSHAMKNLADYKTSREIANLGFDTDEFEDFESLVKDAKTAVAKCEEKYIDAESALEAALAAAIVAATTAAPAIDSISEEINPPTCK